MKPDRRIEQGVAPPCAGVDEAGRGPLAGPVVAAAIVFSARPVPAGLADSKRLSPVRRDALYDVLMADHHVGVGVAEVAEIDRINILQATMQAMIRAVAALPVRPAHVLVDGNRLPCWDHTATAVIGGDRTEMIIAAASIIAKVHRDRLMLALDRIYPDYGWARNMGYGTAIHLEALKNRGATPVHRRSFAPVAAAIAKNGPG